MEIKKKRLDVERKLGNRRLALEERQQVFCEKMALNTQNNNSFLDFSHSDNHDTSVNWISIENKNNRLSGIGDEYFTPPTIDIYHHLIFKVIDVFYVYVLFFLQLELIMPVFH